MIQVDRVESSIRQATREDFSAIWRIFRTVLEEGETYSFTGDEEDARRFWYPTDGQTYVAEVERVVGAALLKRDGADPRTANAAFIVDTVHRGRGIGEKLARRVLEEALALGYSAMQFNFVISTTLERFGSGNASVSRQSTGASKRSCIPASEPSTPW